MYVVWSGVATIFRGVVAPGQRLHRDCVEARAREVFSAVESGRIGVLTEWAEALTVGSRSSGVPPMSNTPPVPVPEESRLTASENNGAVRLSWKMVSMTGDYATWVALGESLWR